MLHQILQRFLGMLSCKHMNGPSGIIDLFESNLFLHH